MASEFETPFREREPTLETLTGFGRQLLEAVTEREDDAMAEGAEQLVFRNPDGIGFKTIDPDMLQRFIEANAPAYNFLPVLQGWRDTDGLVEAVHLWWRLQSGRYEVFDQIRGRRIEGKDQHALQCKITMERRQDDMYATGADVRLGALDKFGNFKNGLNLAFELDSLSTLPDSQANEWLGYLAMEMRSILSYAQILEGGDVRAYRYPIVT